MEHWLAKIRPPRYLRYFFFICYKWYTGYRSERDTAHFTATIFLAFVHLFLLFFILLIFFPDIFLKYSNKYITGVSIATFLGLTHYVLFLYKQKWKDYIKEFKHLDLPKRKLGTYWLILYLLFMIGLNVTYIYYYEATYNQSNIIRGKKKHKALNAFGVAKCISIEKQSSSNFAFFEFYANGRKILGTSSVQVESDRTMINKYFKVNYSSNDVNENTILLQEPVTDTTAIREAGFNPDF